MSRVYIRAWKNIKHLKSDSFIEFSITPHSLPDALLDQEYTNVYRRSSALFLRVGRFAVLGHGRMYRMWNMSLRMH